MMKIAVIGAGAMGSIYGGHLSLRNEVWMVDTNLEIIRRIQEVGLVLEEGDSRSTYHPQAVKDTAGLGQVDLVILFVKALFSRAALSENRGLIGPDTYVMTLQNGSGHEDVLSEFVELDHIIIGTTEDQGTVLGPAEIRHGGEGKTNIGMLVPDTAGILGKLRDNFDACGFCVKVHDNIQQLIWDKLFTNISLSAVTAVLQVRMGYIAGNTHAWEMTRMLLHEAVETAHALGLSADETALLDKVRKTSENVPDGVTSICADLGNGRRTEVDTISGSVVRAAAACGVSVPCHEFLVHMVHALEEKRDSSLAF